MIARTAAVVEPGGVLGELTCAPPLTLRQVHSDVSGRLELRLVGTAAGPLAGDDLAMSLRLRPGARATLRATGASLAQGNGPGNRQGNGPGNRQGNGPGNRQGGGQGNGQSAGTLAIRADLADGSDLIADPGALIVCHGSRVDVRIELALGRDVTLDWRELIVLGRTGEPPGAATLRWDVTRLGRPVLRQFVDLSDPAWTAWAGVTAGRRVMACALIADPAGSRRTVVASPTSVAQRLTDQSLLVTVLGDDAATVAAELDSLCARAR